MATYASGGGVRRKRLDNASAIHFEEDHVTMPEFLLERIGGEPALEGACARTYFTFFLVATFESSSVQL